MQEPVHLVGSPAMIGRCILAVLLLVSATLEASPGFVAVGEEIVRTVRDEFLHPGKARQWAEENAGYGAAVQDAEAFRRETRQRLAALATSHTAYYTPDDPGYYDLLAIFEAVLKKNPETESLGLAVVERDGGWFVDRVLAGGPAETTGIRRGDRLATADGAPFHPKLSLRGKAGRPVRLGVQSRRNGPVHEISMAPRLVNPRQEWVEAQRAGSRILEARGRRIAYAPLWSCAGEDFQGLLAESLGGDLQEAEALVLDLRGGWGGCNPSFVSLFDPAVPDLTRIGRSGEPVVWASSWRKPVVVLIDGGSRSGKEVVARALQRHKRATLVGERTAGAVVAGRPFLLSDGSLLFLAVEDVRVDGERLEGVGVTPDVPVPPDLLYAEGRDPQLERALDLAARQTAGGR
jgi:carboxyl-terminal processing protease